MRKLMGILLVLVLLITFSVGAVAAGFEKTASPSQTRFVMDGKTITFDNAYNIDDSNYIQLRSVAQMLSGTKSQFNVYWDEELQQAVIETGLPYTGVKPAPVVKDVYGIGDKVSMKGVDITITNTFTTNSIKSGGVTLESQPDEVFYGVSFTILASEKPYPNVGLDVYSFMSGITTQKGQVYTSFKQVNVTQITLNNAATGTIYYTIKQTDQIASVGVRDFYDTGKTVLVY
jgi:hypothetical protein